MSRRALALLALVLSGCGSAGVAELPPAAEPRKSPPLTESPAGRIVRVGQPGSAPAGPALDSAQQTGGVIELDDGGSAVISARERVVEVFGSAGRRRAREPAGVGPTHGVSMGGHLWVTDTQGDGLLVFRLEPELRLVRRHRLATGPYGIALDRVRQRLWVTLTGTNRVVELPAHGRPHVVASYPALRQPNDIAVDSRTGRVFVGGGADGLVQVLDPPGTRDANGVGEG